MDKRACTTQKISFKVFCNEQKAKLQVKYPFLSKSQINLKIKQLWKKMDITEKQCYTKTVLSPPKFKKNVPVKQQKKPQTIQVSQNSTSMIATKGIKDSGDKDISPVLKQILVESQTENKIMPQIENSEDSVSETREAFSKSRYSTDAKIDVQKNQGRKTVPWKGRPSLGSTDLWSDSSPPNSNDRKKAKSTKKQKEVQGILKPSGDAPRLKAKNRVSFGSPQNELSSTLLSQTNSGDFNTANSDDEDNGVQLLCRTDEDMYDFEKIASYGLCVEEEDIYANQNRYIPENWKLASVNETTNESIQQSNEKISDFKIPPNRVIKKKKGAKQLKVKNDDGKLLSPLTEGFKNSPVAVTTPQTGERQKTEFLITPQMNEVLVEHKLQEAKKTPKKNKADSPKSTSRTGSVRKNRGQGLDPEERKVSDEKQSSDTDSLSITPLTESLSSGAESIVSPNPNIQDGVERCMNVLSEKLQRMHGTENVTIPKDDAWLAPERGDATVMKSMSSYSMKNFALLPQKRRRCQKQKDLHSPSEVSESSIEKKENVVKKPRQPNQNKKIKQKLKSSTSSDERKTKTKRTKRKVEENKSPKPCKATRKVKSPVGRMDADKLISESPNKIDFNKNSHTEELSPYFTGDSDSSSTADDIRPTNKVLMTAILRMQRAVQCPEISDTEASSPCLSGISQLSSVVSEKDSTTEEAAEEKESVNRLSKEIQESSNSSDCTDSTKSQTPVQIPIHLKIGKEVQDHECLECMDVPHDGKKICSPIKDSHADGDEKDVFQMFSKFSPAKSQNMQGRRFIASSEHEGRSNFKDLFQDNNIF
ncbi:uncharacterized protein LOC133173084 [Saccostrea echinata]|uniref:uncharacterized protein LOC133173084 n=1 Tax=Saccostrea echinata TaxID=191078 RepID=UPI002A837DFB|nr:uncharacterized protein LOC133173084 [Saccostrea echinata]